MSRLTVGKKLSYKQQIKKCDVLRVKQRAEYKALSEEVEMLGMQSRLASQVTDANELDRLGKRNKSTAKRFLNCIDKIICLNATKRDEIVRLMRKTKEEGFLHILSEELDGDAASIVKLCSTLSSTAHHPSSVQFLSEDMLQAIEEAVNRLDAFAKDLFSASRGV